MPHSDERYRCPYCGTPLLWKTSLVRELVCPAHRDLPALEPLDDRYLLTETGRRG